MLKKELRLLYKKKRQHISSEMLIDHSLIIANKLLQIPSIWNFKYYHLFLPIVEQKEIDTSFILSILQGKDKNVVLPKVEKNNILASYLLTDSTILKKNKWNIPEPTDGIIVPEDKIEVVFIPLLAFDSQGHRVGYGKGFYDTLLKKCNSKVLKIGLSFFEATEKISDIDKWDIPLDYCITPKKTYTF